MSHKTNKNPINEWIQDNFKHIKKVNPIKEQENLKIPAYKGCKRLKESLKDIKK